jgi:hypothetical protein
MKETKETPRKKDSIIEKVLHLAFESSQNKRKLGFSDGNKTRFKSIVAKSWHGPMGILPRIAYEVGE